MITTRAEAAHYLKDAGGLKLVVIGADGTRSRRCSRKDP
jgi:hypothetical protein